MTRVQFPEQPLILLAEAFGRCALDLVWLNKIQLPSVVLRHMSSARLAQSVERKTLNLVVVGSSPTVGMCFFGPR